jgi:DNA topoisomerase-3
MILCIAEKPSVAKDIANIIGAKSRKDGYYEGNGFQVSWTFGHLCTLKEPHEYWENWKKWDLSYLPMIPSRFGIKIIDNPGVKKQFSILEHLIQNATEVINCGDAGQEGELIQRWVMQKAGIKCPVKRLWISSLTEESIKNGFATLKNESDFQHLYEAGLCRAIGDWLLGMNATRLYTLRFGNNNGVRSVLSIGRVQTPTLALITKRTTEIANFTPEQYWELKTTYRNTVFSSTKGKFNTEEDGKTFLNTIKNAPFEITEVNTKKGNEAPPRLFDLTSLQVECNKKYGFSAEDTLKHIQSLYEKKITTYPRVDTTYLSEDIHAKCGTILNELKDFYGTYLDPLRGKALPKSKKIFDNKKITDHHAIIPTGVKPTTLSEPEKKVFDLVARRFLGIFYPDCKISTTTVMGQTANVEFKTTGKQILEMGWRVIWAKEPSASDNSENEEQTLPDFKKGEQGDHLPELAEKWTTPPKPYTEATLLRAMETAGKGIENEELREALKENGIGRPSTRAAIIETLFKRQYIRREKKNIIATQTGIDLIETIQDELIKSAELTGLWEKKLREIERGEYKAQVFIEELKQLVNQIVINGKSIAYRTIAIQPTIAQEIKEIATKKKKTTKQKKDNQKEKKNPDDIIGTICPLCHKGTIIKGNTAYGCSEWKNGCSWRKPF